MATATEYLRSAIGDHVLNNTALTSPTDVYIALFTTDSDATGPGTEVTGGSYARQAIPFVENATAGEFENTSVSFTDMPEATVVGIGIFDASTAGNMLYFANFSPVSVGATDTYPVDGGTVTITHI